MFFYFEPLVSFSVSLNGSRDTNNPHDNDKGEESEKLIHIRAGVKVEP